MADIAKIKQALSAYTGDNETLDYFVSVATAELGNEWVQTIYDVMTDLTQTEQERLDYAYRHYAATAAWNEAQTYLMQTEPLDVATVTDRIPVLEHWLAFYQDAGAQVVEQLKQKLSAQPVVQSVPQEQVMTATTAESPREETIVQQEQPKAQQEEPQPAAAQPVDASKSEALWAVEKIRREVEITKELQAWVAARCVGLGNREVMNYPYYGLVVDVMRQTRKQIQSLLESEEMLAEITHAYPDEVQKLQDYQLMLDKDIEVATQNGLDQDLDLLGNLSIDEVKRILGQLDTSNAKEESEPAPDGFVPILDSDSDLDEGSIKDEYSQIENVVLSDSSQGITKNKDENEKNASQTAQNSVKKKLSFSLGNKKNGTG